MNIFICTGRLTKDPILRTTPSGKFICQLNVAVNKDYKHDGQPSADFFIVSVWGNSANACTNFLAKGSRVGIHGSLQNHSYKGKDGSTHYVTEIMAHHVEFLDSKSKAQYNNDSFQEQPQDAYDINETVPY